MVRYQRNNILFRIASAAAISKFKSIQAHSFGQLNRREFEFDASAREVVLLAYDRFSQWIYRVERICLSATSSGRDITTLIPSLIASFIDEQRITQTVIESHPDIFKNSVDEYVRRIHDYTARTIDSCFESLEGKKVEELYTEVVELTTKYLQHMLVAMHEFNNNCITLKEAPFISMAEISHDLPFDKRHIPCIERLKFFGECYNHHEFAFKYYGTNPEASDDMYAELAELCKYLNITLVKEEHPIEQEE